MKKHQPLLAAEHTGACDGGVAATTPPRSFCRADHEESESVYCVSPMEAAKKFRRRALEVLMQLTEPEEKRRAAITAEESLAWYGLQCGRYREAFAVDRLLQEEDASRCVLVFTERSERRKNLNKHASTLSELRTQSSIAATCSSSVFPSASSALHSPPGAARRRTLGATSILSDTAKMFIVMMDQLEEQQMTERTRLRESQEAARHMLSEYYFYDEFYEFRLNVFNNVPSVDDDEKLRRARCMMMLHELREREAIAEDWFARFKDITTVLSPFQPASILRLSWVELTRNYFLQHFNFLDGPWHLEELHAREALELRFREETSRVLVSVRAYIVLREPEQRQLICREQRRHRAVVTATHHPRIQEIRTTHKLFVMRKFFRRLVGLRAYRQATVQRKERITIMASLSLESLRLRYFSQWQQRILRKHQTNTISVMAREHFRCLSSRYFSTMARFAAHRVHNARLVLKIERNTNSLLRDCVWRKYFIMWRRFGGIRRAERLLNKNQLRNQQVFATKWYWGIWYMKRRRQYRVKLLKLERMAQLWRLGRAMEDWGPNGFLALKLAERNKTKEVMELSLQSHHRLMQHRWKSWCLFLKRRKQSRIAIKLERLNNNYTKIRRFGVWLMVINMRHAVRNTNYLLSRFSPYWTHPYFDKWVRFSKLKKHKAAATLWAKNAGLKQHVILSRWKVWAHRHWYRRMAVEEGQLEMLARRNAFRYQLRRWQGWIGDTIRRRRGKQVLQLRDKNLDTIRRRVFATWAVFRIRKPQWDHVASMEHRFWQTIGRRYFDAWMKHYGRRELRRDKHMVAESLSRRTLRRHVLEALRRWNRRCCFAFPMGKRGPALIHSIEHARQTRYFMKWKAWLRFRKDTRVADNLHMVNADRWHQSMWSRWRNSACVRRRLRQVEELRQRNRLRHAALAWRRAFTPLQNVLVIQQHLGTLRQSGEATLQERYFREWSHFCITWKKEMLAQSLYNKNVHDQRSEVMRLWMVRRTTQRLTEVRRRLCYTCTLSNSATVGMNHMSQIASQRYFHRWVAWLKRRVSRKVASEALSLLRVFWIRRACWSVWCTTTITTTTTTRGHVGDGDAPSCDGSLRKSLRSVQSSLEHGAHGVLALEQHESTDHHM